MASPKTSLPNITSSIFNVSQLNLQHYEDQLLLYTITGLVNRKYPNLFLDTGSADMDFPQSDRHWIEHLTNNRNVTFTTIAPTLCALVTHFQQQMQWSTVLYRNDTYSSHIAATISGIHGNYLPVSHAVLSRHTCLQTLPIGIDLIQIATQHFHNKIKAYEWAIQHLLPKTSKTVLFNADHYSNAVPQRLGTYLMSLDYPIMHGAFIMNLSPLYKCDPLDCGNPSHRHAMPNETKLFVDIVESRNELVSLFGWGDPGKYSKRRRSNVAVIIVRIVFISSLLFYCLFS